MPLQTAAPGGSRFAGNRNPRDAAAAVWFAAASSSERASHPLNGIISLLIYPANADIRRRSENSGGADYALRDVLVQLVDAGADVLITLDSDLIVASNFLEAGIELLGQSDGVLSLFNTPNHPPVSYRSPFVLKKTIGSAATLWRRDLALEMLAHVAPGPRFDWRFSEFLVNAGYQIYVTNNSYVQHAGFYEGQNSRSDIGDVGIGFSDADPRNSYRLAEIILHYMQSMASDNAGKISALDNRVNALEKRMHRVDSLLGLTLARQIKRFFGR